MQKFINRLQNKNPFFWAALLSFGLSIYLSYNTLVNSDGILYLRVAREFMQHNFEQGFALYNWVFYPALIAGFSKLSTLSLENSAFLINAFFFAILATGFIALVRELGGDRRIQWFAVLVFLVHPGINGYREYIVRDFGFWAFLIWSLVFLCKYAQMPRARYVLAWFVTGSLAFLFRIEALIWLALGPLSLLVGMKSLTFKSRLVSLIRFQSVFIALGLLGIASVLLFDISIPIGRLDDFHNAYVSIVVNGVERYALKAESFASLMSIYFKFDHALFILGIALFAYWVFLSLKLLSPLYVLLVGYGLYHHQLLKQPQIIHIVWALIVFAAIYITFVFQSYFVSSRYLIPWVVIAMVWVPFALAKLWEKGPMAVRFIVGLILVYMFLDSVISMGYSKEYLREGGEWIETNTPANATLITNSNHLAYYANKPEFDWSKDFKPDYQNIRGDYDMIVLRYSRKTDGIHALFEEYKNYPQVDFHNKRNDGIRIILLTPKVQASASDHPQG